MVIKRVLVVEDSLTQSFQLKIRLEASGFQVLQARNGKDALKLAIQEKPDVILSDILMPEMDGFELCHSVRTNSEIQQIPIILQSASYHAKEDQDFGLEIGADAFIPKGSSAEELAELINKVIKRSQEKNYQKSNVYREPFDIVHSQRMLYKLLEEATNLERANSIIEKERNRAQKYLNVASVVMIAFDCDVKVTMINPMGCQILGEESKEIIGQDWINTYVSESQRDYVREFHKKILASKNEKDEYLEYSVITKISEERLIAWHNSILKDDDGEISGILSSGEDITKQRQNELKIRESEQKYRSLFENVPDGVYRISTDFTFLAGNPSLVKMVGYQSESEMLETCFLDLFTDPDEKEKISEVLRKGHNIHNMELRLKHKKGQLITVLNNAIAIRDVKGVVRFYEGTLTDITQLKQFEAELSNLYKIEQKRVKHLSDLQKISNQLANIRTQSEVMEIVAERAKSINNDVVCALLKIDKNNNVIVVAESGFSENLPVGKNFSIKIPLINQVLKTGKLAYINLSDLEESSFIKYRQHKEIQSIRAIPIIFKDQILAIMLLGSRSAQPPLDWEITLMELLAERTAIALENARLFEEINTNLQRLASLRSIDQAITSSREINFTIDILLKHVLNQLNVHAADILLLDKENGYFYFGYGKGFDQPVSQEIKIKIDGSPGGEAVSKLQTIHISNILEEIPKSIQSDYYSNQGFITLTCSPLIVNDEVIGVLEVFQREQIEPSSDWLSFLEMLAGQAAIAIDNIGLFENLQKSNIELSMAYDETIQGWSMALDLRDKETEGHTQRVTEMTMKLAKEIGFDENELIYLRWGALLHDIGKMGIPDNILLKPGPLTDEEWVIMRKHPKFAYDLLSPINYLKPALDIPYYHHEKWDGSGYPTGLKEEEIPLSARIFAVADVWDALTSDRPYRKAWSKEKSLDLIKDQSGKHFDPEVVKVFMKKYT